MPFCYHHHHQHPPIYSISHQLVSYALLYSYFAYFTFETRPLPARFIANNRDIRAHERCPPLSLPFKPLPSSETLRNLPTSQHICNGQNLAPHIEAPIRQRRHRKSLLPQIRALVLLESRQKHPDRAVPDWEHLVVTPAGVKPAADFVLISVHENATSEPRPDLLHNITFAIREGTNLATEGRFVPLY
ncbi:hypothetical protein B0H14DRAFT_1199557 [Mycena olivaceomarginata]|nr:hypothetical protein B0H14DRAFT_1199557 [Mycena olivaceomarginata]